MADFDVRAFDDDGADHSNDFNSTTDEGWFVPTDFSTLGATYPFYLKHYNTAESAEIGATGTGLFNPFLNMNGDSTLIGFNTNDDIKKPYTDAGLDISDPNTDAIQLGDIPIVYKDLDGNGTPEAYYVINLDINENVNSEVSLEELQLYTSSASAVLADYHGGSPLAFANNPGDPATDFTLRFDLDAGGDNKLIMRDDGAGQGKLDYTFYFPVGMFAGAAPTDYLTLFSQFGPNPPDDAGFAEWNVLTAAKIAGIKFSDVNGDGLRDTDGVDNILGNGDDEVGLAGFTMYIDLNGNNKLDANEQTALTDANGAFLFASLLPNATYVVREVLTSADVNGPGDAGPDVNFATYAPPAGLWDQTTDDGTGDQVVIVTTGTTNILVGNRLLLPSMNVTKAVTSITGGQGVNGLTGADSAGDVIHYAISVQNTGDVPLTGLTITDPNANAGSIQPVTSGGFNTGDTDHDNVFDAGETWNFTATHTVTQAELDGKGIDIAGAIDGDGDDDNRVTADTNETAPDTADAAAPLIFNPHITVDKTASVDGDCADVAGELVNYSISVTNDGNVTLDTVNVTDPMADSGSILGVDADNDTFNDGDTDADGKLDVGETWLYTATHTVTQGEIDAGGNYDSSDPPDGINDSLRNVATATAEVVGTATQVTDDDDAVVEVCQNPGIDLEKYVAVDSTNGTDGTFVDADDALGPENVNLGADVWFKVTVENTGNITLTDVDIKDVNQTGGGSVNFDLMLDGALTADAITNHSATIGGDTDNDGKLDVGETWTITYKQPFDPGDHVNTATVTTHENQTDSDAAHYFSLVDEGLCPRTPGFWQNPKNGGQFWDGQQGNEKHGGEAGFPAGELLYAVDSNHDGLIDSSDAKGLLIGDYDHDGLTGAGEDTLFVSYADAQTLINASAKQLNSASGDGRYMLGRDMVASWLNYLQGSGFGDASDPQSPHHYLDDTIDWMQIYVGTNSGGNTETFDKLKLSGSAIKTNTATWNTPQSGIDHSASQMHSALDYYNNTGQTQAGGTHYANCESQHLFEALSIYQQAHELV